MKKNIFIFLFAIVVVACNKQPQVDCGTYPYCTTDYSIHPDNWLCGKLKAEVSPYNKKDTVIAMTVKYVYDSDMNGLTYFITQYNDLISLLNDDGTRLETINIKVKYDYMLYPFKHARELPSRYDHCQWELEERLEDNFTIDERDLFMRCLDLNDHVLIFNYELELHDGQTYDNVIDGDTIHLFELNEEAYFNDVSYPV